MDTSINSAGGGFTAPPFVQTKDGVKYYFSIDLPVVVGEMEEECLAWLRRKNAKKLSQYPSNPQPGTLDFERVQAIRESYDQAIDTNSYKVGGEVYRQFEQTEDGKYVGIIAALRPRHPEADRSLAMRLMKDHMSEIMMIFQHMGKELAAYGASVATQLAAKDPQAAASVREQTSRVEQKLSELANGRPTESPKTTPPTGSPHLS